MKTTHPSSNSSQQGSTAFSLKINRACSNVPLPYWQELPHSQFVTASRKLCLKNILVHFLRQGRLSREDANYIVQKATLLLREEPNLLSLDEPVVVVGSINGQLYDLAKILSVSGGFGGKNFLFLGGYIGNGGFSCECLLFLLAAKLVYPNSVFLLRGSNESKFMANMFDFEAECFQKYLIDLHKALMVACSCLPLAAVVSGKYFCVYGGLSPDISEVADINCIHRFREIPTKGAMCDLLWSDPYWDVQNPASSSFGHTDHYTPRTESFNTVTTFYNNVQRGCSFLFNFACVRHFIKVNKLTCLIRSHEVHDEGYKLYRPHPNTIFPCMVSVFSAPNYCDTFDNRGAIIDIANGTLGIKQFFQSPHPFHLNSKNAVSWSLPFMIESVHSFVRTVLDDDDA